MLLEANADLLSVAVTVAATGILGLIIYLSERESATNKAFVFFCSVTVLWGISNYLNYQVDDNTLALWLIRLVMFFGIYQALAFYFMLSVFPDRGYTLNSYEKYALIPLVIFTSILTLTPLIFSGLDYSPDNIVAQPIPGPAIPLFALSAFISVFFGVKNAIKKIRKSDKKLQSQFKPILLGALVMFGLIITFNFLYSILLNDTSFIPLGSIFSFPFVFLTFYAIKKHNLFNVKVLSTALLTVILAVVTFSEVVLAKDITLIIFRAVEFLLVLVFGSLIIRSVIREVEQREEIQKLATELQVANDQQSVLIHFITHQIKGFFTMSRNIFSLMLEDTFGPLNPDMRRMAQQGFDNVTKGVTTVQDILSAANLKKGTVTMNMKPFDLRALIDEVLSELKPRFDAKSLQLATVLSSGPILVSGDRFQLHEVYKNLIDNSIRYTPSGTVAIKLEKKDTVAHFEVKDSGVGLSDDDKKRLFTEGGRGKESLKVNVDSTGFGLFIVKGIVDQHKGKVWADSEGKGKGSTFCVDLPLIP